MYGKTNVVVLKEKNVLSHVDRCGRKAFAEID